MQFNMRLEDKTTLSWTLKRCHLTRCSGPIARFVVVIFHHYGGRRSELNRIWQPRSRLNWIGSVLRDNNPVTGSPLETLQEPPNINVMLHYLNFRFWNRILKSWGWFFRSIQRGPTWSLLRKIPEPHCVIPRSTHTKLELEFKTDQTTVWFQEPPIVQDWYHIGIALGSHWIVLGHKICGSKNHNWCNIGIKNIVNIWTILGDKMWVSWTQGQDFWCIFSIVEVQNC